MTNEHILTTEQDNMVRWFMVIKIEKFIQGGSAIDGIEEAVKEGVLKEYRGYKLYNISPTHASCFCWQDNIIYDIRASQLYNDQIRLGDKFTLKDGKMLLINPTRK